MNDDSNIKTIEKEENGVKITYIGQVCDDLIEGKGMITKINKSNNNIISVEIGEFKNNNLNGFGIIKTENEQIEGIFKDGKMNGKMCLYNDSLIEYSEYKNGLKNGRTIKFNNDNFFCSSLFKASIIAFLSFINSVKYSFNFFILFGLTFF